MIGAEISGFWPRLVTKLEASYRAEGEVPLVQDVSFDREPIYKVTSL